jgi:23S rRNA pseudouridine2605 synthase
MPIPEKPERLQKFLSQAGFASRRQAEALILDGVVFVNGQKAQLGDRVNPARDIVKVHHQIVTLNPSKIYLLLNKPKGVLVSKYDPHAGSKKTVFDLLPVDLRDKVWAIGRLDVDTEGLLILTNDGELTEQLAHPKYEHEKEYEVRVQEAPSQAQLERLRNGVLIPTGRTYPAKVEIKNSKIYLTIHEGKKRQIRHMIKNVGLTLLNLKRIRMNELRLPEDLKVGAFVYTEPPKFNGVN